MSTGVCSLDALTALRHRLGGRSTRAEFEHNFYARIRTEHEAPTTIRTWRKRPTDSLLAFFFPQPFGSVAELLIRPDRRKYTPDRISNNLIQKNNAQKLVLLGLAERAVLLHPIVENLLFRHPPARTTVRSWRLRGKGRRWSGRKAKGPCQRNRRLARCSLSRLTRQEARPIRWHPSTGHVSYPFSIVVAAAHSESH